MSVFGRVPKLGRRRRSNSADTNVVIDDRTLTPVPGSGVVVYETQGRLVLRAVDGSDGAGIERDQNHVVELAELTNASLGELVLRLAHEIMEVERPSAWSKLSEYAAPLIATAPTRHRSFRSWQRVTRNVSVSFGGRIVRSRMHADLGRGAWVGAAANDVRTFPQQIELESPTTSSEIGTAVMQLLVEPPIAG